MEFRILGRVEASIGGQPLHVGGARQRALLAFLLLHANEQVTAEQLLHELWPQPPAGGVAAVRTQVHRLRKVLGERIATVGPSYELRLEPQELDVDRFRSLVAEAATAADSRARSRLLRDADALWYGEPLSGIEAPFVTAERASLAELRLAAVEERIDADLDQQLETTLVSELSTLVVRHPLRERLRGQLMLALYRSGRQAEALEAYREIRRTLDQQLGLEPSPFLRELEQAILRQDPSLSAGGPARRPTRRSGPPRHRRARRGYAFAAGGAATAVALVVVALAGGFAGGGTPAVFSDSLRGSLIDTASWDIEIVGAGPVVAPSPSGVRLTIPAHAAPAAGTGFLEAHLATYCWLTGPFDVEVDYRLLAWPPANGVAVGMYAAYGNLMRESTAAGGDQYVGTVTHFAPPDRGPATRLDTKDLAGTLRITRVGDRLDEQVRTRSHWQRIHLSAPQTEYPNRVFVYLSAWTDARRFAHREVNVEFDNFRIVRGALSCPASS